MKAWPLPNALLNDKHKIKIKVEKELVIKTGSFNL